MDRSPAPPVHWLDRDDARGPQGTDAPWLRALLGLGAVGACLLVFGLYMSPAFSFELVSRWMLC